MTVITPGERLWGTSPCVQMDAYATMIKAAKSLRQQSLSRPPVPLCRYGLQLTQYGKKHRSLCDPLPFPHPTILRPCSLKGFFLFAICLNAEA